MEIDPEVTETTSAQGVFLEIRDKVLEITLDRPKANAINCAVSRALAQAFLYLHTQAYLRVGLLTGGGERFFSAGWDLKAAAAGEAVDADHGPGGFGGLTEFFELEKPVIAAVNGLAVGGGFELALACDLIVAADHAEFFLPESGLGIIPDSGGALRLPRLLPRAVAMELLLTGRRMSAAQAAQLGLVNQVVPQRDLLPQARALADAIATKAPLATTAIKAILTKTPQMSLEEGYRALRAGQIPAYTRLLRSDDAREGIAAYNQGRAPSWKGR